jgi:hypothetical protein
MNIFNRKLKVNLTSKLFIGVGVGYDWEKGRYESSHQFIITVPFIILEVTLKKTL